MYVGIGSDVYSAHYGTRGGMDDGEVVAWFGFGGCAEVDPEFGVFEGVGDREDVAEVFCYVWIVCCFCEG